MTHKLAYISERDGLTFIVENALIERLAREAGFGHLIGVYPDEIETIIKAMARECAEIGAQYIRQSPAYSQEGITKAIRERFGL